MKNMEKIQDVVKYCVLEDNFNLYYLLEIKDKIFITLLDDYAIVDNTIENKKKILNHFKNDLKFEKIPFDKKLEHSYTYNTFKDEWTSIYFRIQLNILTMWEKVEGLKMSFEKEEPKKCRFTITVNGDITPLCDNMEKLSLEELLQ